MQCFSFCYWRFGNQKISKDTSPLLQNHPVCASALAHSSPFHPWQNCRHLGVCCVLRYIMTPSDHTSTLAPTDPFTSTIRYFSEMASLENHFKEGHFDHFHSSLEKRTYCIYLRLPRLLGPLWNCERMKHTFQKIKHLPSKVLSFMKNPPNPSISNFIFQKFHAQNHPSYEQVSASAPWPRIRPKVVMRVDEMTDWLVVSTHLKKH